MNVTKEINQFIDLFRGRTDALGLNRGGVERRMVTWGDYYSHWEGMDAIGIFPMLNDSTVYFGAIDLDEPRFDLARQLQRLIPAPSWVERSRSGNAHVWVFFREPCPAWRVRTVLKGACETVGRPQIEVFPKQDVLLPGMVGNYINLPWFGPERPILRSDTEELIPMNREHFLHRAHAERQDPAVWERRARMLGGQPPQEREATSEWGEQANLHQCAAYIMEHREDNPVRSGHRAVVLFSLAKMLLNWREATEGEAWNWLKSVNDAAEPPIPEYELRRIFQNALNGKWTSTGCDDPLMADYVHPDCPIAHG